MSANRLMIGCLTLGLMAVWLPASPGQPTAASVASWEFKTIFGTSNQSNDKELNRLGKDGWELYTIHPEGSGGVVRFVLKRSTPLRVDESVQPVSGTVTLDGKPVDGGEIVFILGDGEFVGTRLRDGRYTPTRLSEGTYRVGLEGEGVSASKYGPETGSLTVQIKEGTNVFDFILTKQEAELRP